MKRNVLFILSLVMIALMTVACTQETVVSPGVRHSSVVYRTSAAGVKDTITLSDSLQVGDTVLFPMVLNGYYDYLNTFMVSADTTKVQVSLLWNEEDSACLAPSANPEQGLLVFNAGAIYACMTTLKYVPKASGVHRIDLALTSAARSPYSSWAGYFYIGVK